MYSIFFIFYFGRFLLFRTEILKTLDQTAKEKENNARGDYNAEKNKPLETRDDEILNEINNDNDVSIEWDIVFLGINLSRDRFSGKMGHEVPHFPALYPNSITHIPHISHETKVFLENPFK